MEFETAKHILQKEFVDFKEKNDGGRLAIELFGGEPMTHFPLIKQIYEWVSTLDLSIPILFQITTNGTLFTDEIKAYLESRKKDFRIVMSIDGDEAMQKKNRGLSIDSMSTEWVKKVWPNSYFKMTLSSDTLVGCSSGMMELNKENYRVAFSLAQGAEWKDNDHLVYQEELEKAADYFLSKPDNALEHPFNMYYQGFLDETSSIPAKGCGCSSTIAMYDTDGQLYPCHLFLPIVHGKDIKDEIDNIDFSNDEKLINSECKNCKMLKACSTCYGYNFVERGDVAERDMTMCKLRLAEVKVVTAFQLKHFMGKKDSLNDEELLMLKAAYKCHSIVKDLDYEYFNNRL